ncbi:nuclear transport factor 2 family protein [Nonomuraea fastidiosa]|jgi:ketosteroid isomerase-like protein|uniref:nuclear transport factor 2 family protein n=1 Tax=Nonomuraea TaxID=83681 RepID=UPI0032455B81
MEATELVERGIALLLAKDMSGFAGLWAEDGVIEFPFAPPGYPRKVEGREAIREYLRDYPEKYDVREVVRKVIHRTENPEVVVVELEVAGIVPRSGEPYRMEYVAIITVRDGEIRHYRDYWNPLQAARAMGGLEALTKAFAGGAA